jgi:hypothetical protein
MSGVVTVQRATTSRPWTSTSDPTNAFDAGDGVRVGDHWYNTASGNVFVCVTNTVGAAVWRHIPRVLGATGASAAHTGDTNETVKGTVAIPAGAMGVNGFLRIQSVWTMTNSANVKTFRIRLGGIGGNVFLNTTATTQVSGQVETIIRNRNSASSQVGFTNATFTSFGTSSGSNQTASQNTASALDLVFTALLASAGETITLEGYSVELSRPDIT